jgi:hypothetical protein
MTRRTVCFISFEIDNPGWAIGDPLSGGQWSRFEDLALMSEGSKPANDFVSTEELRDMLSHLREANETTRLLLDQIVESIRSVNDTHLREFDELAVRIQRKLDER